MAVPPKDGKDPVHAVKAQHGAGEHPEVSETVSDVIYRRASRAERNRMRL